MSLAGVKAGDIIRADQQHCHVIDVEHGGLRVQPIGRSPGARTVKARQVEAHWRRTAK